MACILNTVCGYTFDIDIAMNNFIKRMNSGYGCKFSETEFKRIASGFDSAGYNEWKGKYEPKETKAEKKTNPESNQKLTTSQQLRLMLVEVVGDKYRREYGTGAIYERKTDYYYTRKYNDPMIFLNHIFADEELYHMCSKKDSDELVSFIKSKAHPKFGWIELDYNFVGFTDGVYDLSSAKFIPVDEVPKGIQVRKFFNQEGDINKETTMFDKYLSFQFEKAEDLEIVYFAMGRCMTKLEDKFDFMVMLHGQGGSGKSILQNFVKYSFGEAQVGYLSNSFQDCFGLSEFASKPIVCCDDMPRNLAKTLPRSDFLSMMTRGAISCPVKGKASIEVPDWNLPTMINSNHLPNYKDEAGEIVRRMLMINFGKQVPDNQVNVALEQKIKYNEYAAVLHKCRSTYLKLKEKYAGQKLSTFLPETFREQTEELREALNNSYAFAIFACEYEKDSVVTAADMRNYMLKWLKKRFSLEKLPKEALNTQEILRIDSRFKYFEGKACRHCNSDHKKGCCDKYNSSERSTMRKFTNIKLRDELFEFINEFPQ